MAPRTVATSTPNPAAGHEWSMNPLPPPGTFLAFVAAAGAIVLMPGPDTVTVLSQGATRGRRAGVATALGVSTGVLVHATAVALGLAAVLRALPGAVTAIKLVGATYLVYLAVATLRAGDVLHESTDGPETGGPYRAGFLVNATNPKVAIFFLAFLPAFATGNSDTWLQLLALGATYSVLSGLYLGGVGLAAGSVQSALESARAQRALRLLSGTALFGLAAVIALDVGP